MKNLQSSSSIVISKFQQQCIWENIIIDWINNNKIEEELISISHSWQLANKALEAWHILNAWNIPLDSLKKYFWCQESQSFLIWAQQYKYLCNKFNYVEHNFKDNYFFLSLRDYSIKDSQTSPTCFKVACSELTQEIVAAANWAKQLTGSVGIVLLNLEQIYPQVDYIFSNFFNETEYTIYLPFKLNSVPSINIALLILQIANCYVTNNYIKHEDFSNLLRSKFIDYADLEQNSRSYMDYLLRRDLEYEVDWQYLLNSLQKNKAQANCDIFIKLCSDFSQELAANKNDLKVTQDCQYWVNFCSKILQTFLWTNGSISCKEQSNNTLNNWEFLCNQYLSLSNFLGKHDLTSCIKTLTKIINQNLDKPVINNDNSNKTINILGLLEALQLKFDNLWICGLSDVHWLENYQPNPFLPISLQKEFKIPFVNSDSLTDNYSSLLHTLINNTINLVICSYPLYVDGNRVSYSKLIELFPESPKNFLKDIVPQYDDMPENIDLLETYTDDFAPIYEQQRFSGTNFLKLQAACPFRANAKIRLKADPLKIPSYYLEANTKGEILHKTMECFWLKYKNSEEVKRLSTNDIHQELADITFNVLKKLQLAKPIALNSTILKIEANRIANICFNFIKHHELNRDSFIALYLEKKFVVNLKDFLITIKIDRIDQLANNKLSVIDYKTGNFKAGAVDDWQDPRIDDPQLLIYSLAFSNIDELKLAIMSFNNTKVISLSNWREQQDIWLENLYKLAKDFQNGVAVVDPKHGSVTCRICDLKYMCRVPQK